MLCLCDRDLCYLSLLFPRSLHQVGRLPRPLSAPAFDFIPDLYQIESLGLSHSEKNIAGILAVSQILRCRVHSES